MTEREARFVKDLMSFLEGAKVNLGHRGAAHRQAFLEVMRTRLERFFDGDGHRAPKPAKADSPTGPGLDSRIHRVTPRMPERRPGGVVEMTQSESMRIDARVGNAPEMSDG